MEVIEHPDICFIKVLIKPGCKIQVVTPITQVSASGITHYPVSFGISFTEKMTFPFLPDNPRPFFEMKDKERALFIDATKDYQGNPYRIDPRCFHISLPCAVCLTFDYP